MARILLLGPPGSGKGTQAKALAGMFGLLHVAPGDIFRQEVKEGTDLGRLVEGFMAGGQLVPDDVTVRIMEKKLAAPEAQKGYVLDGFPRNLAQAEALDRMLASSGVSLSVVINLEVSPEDILERARTRRVCSRCGKPCNLHSDPPRVPGVCDDCGGQLATRKDDTEETVKERLAVYERHTKPLVDYYAQKGILVNIEGSRPVQDVTDHIVRALAEKGLFKQEEM
ncbi:MAG: adenylate kinase [Bacillota bacterium]|jgi:adenylate kinase